MRDIRAAPRVIAVFLLGCLVFSYPLLALFNVPATVLGVPVLYAYIFGVWAGLIGLIAHTISRAA